MIKFINPGLLTTVQDSGRYGYQRFGMPTAGAMDQFSFELANVLVGNDLTTEVLEATFMGPTIQFLIANTFAVCGADMSPRLNGQPIENGRAYSAPADSLLEMGPAVSGCRAYIAFSGGLEADLVMGSRSTYIKAGIGGIQGRKAKAGDELAFRQPQPALARMDKRVAPAGIGPEYRAHPQLRLILGPQDGNFSQAGLDTLFSGEYTVTQENDRMGYRLSGPPIALAEDQNNNIISDGICFGSVQIPSDQPIIMMAEHQTTGGYAKIGSVISADLPLLAQLKAGDSLSFCPFTVEEAQRIYCERRAALKKLAADLAIPLPKSCKEYQVRINDQQFSVTVEELE